MLNFSYTNISSKDELYKAWRGLKKRKNSHGIDGVTIDHFRDHLETELDSIHTELKSGEYEFLELRPYRLYKQGKGHTDFRPLRIPAVRDRVVQKSIYNNIVSILSQEYNLKNPASYAYLQRRTPKKAIERVSNSIKAANSWILKSDIKNFFEDVDISYLIDEKIKPIISDPLTLQLIESAVKSEIHNYDWLKSEGIIDLFRNSGLPQGSILSPLLSNVYLSEFDRKTLDANMLLTRYADDFIITCDSKSAASAAYLFCQKELNEIGLSLHTLDDDQGKSIITNSNAGVNFLGYYICDSGIFPSSNSYETAKKNLTDILRQNKDLITSVSSMKSQVDNWGARMFFAEYEPAKYEEIDNALRGVVQRTMWRFGFKPKYRNTISNRDLRKIGLRTFSSSYNYYRQKEEQKRT